MNMIFSLLYAPLVFLSLRYFEIESVSIIIFVISSIWFLLIKDKNTFTVLFPLFYICLSLLSFFLGSFWILKLMPLLISTFFTLFILVSYLQHDSIILTFAQRFSKQPLSAEEKEYIHHATLFWFFTSLVNVGLHSWAFVEANLNFWLYYSSVGWYVVFIIAGIVQYLHRKYVFLRRESA